jgi:glycosyltransferase involved in cell wall biosynthesis
MLQIGSINRHEILKKPDQYRPLVSIVTVCLNSEDHLEQTIQSVINQTYYNIEYIVIDGGSSDKTTDIIRKYDSSLEYWVSEPDKGIYDAMNKGISHTGGEWVGILNSDDWYNSKAVEWVITSAKENIDIDVFHGDVMNVEEDGTFTRSAGSHENLLENPALHHPSCFVRKEIYNKWRYDHKFRINADYDFFLRLQKESRTFMYLDVPIAFFRRTGASNKPAFKVVVDRYIIRKRYDKRKATWLLFNDIFDYVDDVLYFYSKRIEMASCEHKLLAFHALKKALKMVIIPILRFAKNLGVGS